MRVLREVRDHCISLDSDRVTVRKKAEESLSHLLNGESAVDALNRSSGPSSGESFDKRDFTWEDVYSYAFRFLKRESKSNSRVASTLLKTVVRKAGLYLGNPGVTVKDMLYILENSSLRESFGFDAVSILEKVISYPENRSLISLSQWEQQLPRAAFSLFENPPKDSDFFICARFLRTVIQESSSYCECSFLSYLPFLEKVITKAKLGAGAFEARSSFLSAGLLLLRASERDLRRAISRMGEAVVPSVLTMFESGLRRGCCGPVISFLRFQMSLHHPNGAKTLKDGAYFGDRTLWYKHLYGIYNNVIDTWIFNNRNKTSLKSNSSLFYLTPELLDLGIEIVRQVCVGEEEITKEITQIVALDTSTQQPVAKRRRVLKVGIESVLENTRNEDKTIALPWLQILSGVLLRYPKDSLSSPQFHTVLNGIIFALQSSKVVAIKAEIINTLRALRLLQVTKEYSADWSLAWESALNIISLNHCVEEGHALIRELLSEVSVKSLRKLIDLYLNRILKCTVHSVETLVSLISKIEVPNKINGKRNILSWLCPYDQEEAFEFWDDVRKENPAVLAAVLCGLSLQSSQGMSHAKTIELSECNSYLSQQNSSPSYVFSSSSTNNQPAGADFSQENSKQLENLILESEFFFSSEGSNCLQSEDHLTKSATPLLNKVMFLEVKELLISLSGKILSSLSSARNTENPLDFVRHGLEQAYLLLLYMNYLIVLKVFADEKEALSERLVGTARSCVSQCAFVSCKMLNGENATKVLNLWRSFFCLEKRFPFMEQVAFQCIPREFLEASAKFVLLQCEKFQKTNTDSTEILTKDKAMDDFDDFDDFDTNENKDSGVSEARIDFDEELTESSYSKQKLTIESAYTSLLSISVPSVTLHNPETLAFFSGFLKKLLKIVTSFDLFTDDFILRSITFMIMTGSDKLIDEEFVGDILVSCQAVARRSARPKAFNPSVSSSLLDLLHALVPHVHRLYYVKSHDLVNLNNYLTFLVAFVRMNAQCDYKRLSFDLQSRLLSVLDALTRIDPVGEWCVWPVKIHNIAAIDDAETGVIEKDDDDKVHVGKSIIRFLYHKSHRLREQAAKSIEHLFSSSQVSIASKRTDFVLVQSVLNRLIQERQKSNNEDDEVNRVGTLMLALGGVCASCQHLERESVTAIILLHQVHNIPMTSLNRVLTKLAVKKGYNGVEEYVASMLGFILKDFIKRGYELKDFPYQLLSPKFENFLHKYEKTVVPLVLWYAPEMINDLSNLFNDKSEVDILENNFSALGAYFLPIIAAKNERPSLLRDTPKKSVNRAIALHDMVFRRLGETSFNSNLTSKVHEVLAATFKNIHDPETLETEFGISLPELSVPNPPFTDQELVINLVDYFSCRIPQRDDKSLLEFLAKNIPDCLQEMCLNFVSSFKTPTDSATQIRSLHGIKMFIDCLNPSSSFKQLPYLVWYLTDVLSNIINNKKNDENVVRIACRVLYTLLKFCITRSSSDIKPYYVSLVNSLLNRFIDYPRDVSVIFDFLLVEHKNVYQDELKKLCPFPAGDEFTEYRKVLSSVRAGGEGSLREDIESFLDDGRQPSTHRLRQLLSSLIDKKYELSHLLKGSSHLRRLSENTINSPLHRLIGKLLELFSSKIEKELVSKILGEIGPINLSTVVLKPYDNVITSLSNSSPVEEYFKVIISELLYLILDANHLISKLASDALKSLCKTDIAAKLIATSKGILGSKDPLLVPFLPSVDDEHDDLTPTSFSIANEPYQDCDWVTKIELDHEEKVKEIVITLLDYYFESNSASIFSVLKPLCAINFTFSQRILPFFIHIILLHGNEEIKGHISSKINTIFKDHYDSKLVRSSSNEYAVHKSCLKTFLGVVQHLRMQKLPREQRGKDLATNWNNNFWLEELNYLFVAQASLDASEYFSAVLYVEVWTLSLLSKHEGIRSIMSKSDRPNVLDVFLSHFPKESRIAQAILYEAFKSLGDIDAFYGCGESRLLEGSELALIDRLSQEGENFKALGFCDSSIGQGEVRRKLLRTLFDSGLYHTLYFYLQNNSNEMEEDTEITDLQYECAWRLGQWDVECTSLNDSTDNQSSFYKNRYFCLANIVRGEDDVKHSLKVARDSISLKDVHSSMGVYEILSQFRALREIEYFRSGVEVQDVFEEDNFSFVRYIRSQRCAYYQSRINKSELEPDSKVKFSEVFIKESTRLAESSLRHKDFNVAKSSILALKRLRTENKLFKFKTQFLEAQLLWEWNNKETAKILLKKLLGELSMEDFRDQESERNKCLYPQVLGTLGQWMYKLKSESAPIILDNYLKRAVSYYEDVGANGSQILEAYINLAKFCDDQYQNLTDHMKSKDFEDKQKLMKEIQEESSQLNEVGKDKDVRQSAVILNRHSNIDKTEVESIRRDQRKYLLLALENYLRAFCSGDSKHDLQIFRFVSLWFSNPKCSEVDALISKLIPKIKTYKFVDLLYQLAARMTLKRENGGFAKILMNLMLQCTLDHPYHTLPVILALANSQADDEYAAGKVGKKSSGEDEDRTSAAKKLLEVLKNKNSKFSKLIFDMNQMCHTLIQFAYEESPPQKSHESSKIRLSSSRPIRKICKLDHIPVLTDSLPISRNGQYSFAGIKEFADYYETVGGVNAPKKIYCLGTDGIKRPMLIKGKDDLRQDAVMQQVFSLMNSFLMDPKLKVQTYKVVALSQRSGVLEWCQNTMPLKDYLVGPDNKSGAHVRYRPGDLTAHDCRIKLSKAQSTKDHKKMLKAFNEICENFHPVMHQFFMENFPSPEMHYERREAYTRSAAAASMVGYILGLGDRHIQNILIHKRTGHLIHIDLGIAFEQGKILPTPETIPFRLSRDIVDGFGPCGVEGTFRRSCESALRVLRENKENIFTVLQVMVYDPLYNWSLTPDKAYRLQFGKAPDAKVKARWEQRDSPSLDGGNRMAERVLLRVGQKLEGFEEGFNMSIQGQVNALIHQARDPNRLCALYPGWSPFV